MKKKLNLTKESKRKLKERFLFLSEKLSDENLEDEDRAIIMAEMKFIAEVMPKSSLKKEIDLSGVIGAIASFFAMAGAGLVSYKLTNKGLFDKNGANLLNPLNFKK